MSIKMVEQNFHSVAMDVFLVHLLVANAVSLQLADSLENSTNCDEAMLPTNFSMKNCCEYPLYQCNGTALDICSTKCNENDTCCQNYCYFETPEVFVDNKFDKSNFKLLIASKYTADGDFVLTEEWKPIVEKALDKCYEEREFHTFG